MFFKIIHNHVYFPTIHYPTPLSSFSSNHEHQFCIPFACTNHLKNSFLSNSVSLWNNLPSQAVICTTLSLFKCHFFHNVHVLWVHCRISNLLLCIPLHSCINVHRKKQKKTLNCESVELSICSYELSMRIYALHSDTLCAVIYPFSGLLYRTLEFCTSECRLNNTRRHLHVSRGYIHLLCPVYTGF